MFNVTIPRALTFSSAAIISSAPFLFLYPVYPQKTFRFFNKQNPHKQKSKQTNPPQPKQTNPKILNFQKALLLLNFKQTKSPLWAGIAIFKFFAILERAIKIGKGLENIQILEKHVSYYKSFLITS